MHNKAMKLRTTSLKESKYNHDEERERKYNHDEEKERKRQSCLVYESDQFSN